MASAGQLVMPGDGMVFAFGFAASILLGRQAQSTGVLGVEEWAAYRWWCVAFGISARTRDANDSLFFSPFIDGPEIGAVCSSHYSCNRRPSSAASRLA